MVQHVDFDDLPELDDLPDLTDATAADAGLDSLPAPARHVADGQRQETITGLKKQALTALIGALPAPDATVWLVSNGSGGTYGYRAVEGAFEFGHFIPVLVDMIGPPVDDVYVSTWSMNRHHAAALLRLYDEGKARRIAVMSDNYFLRREAAIATALKIGLEARPGCRFKSFKNHTKIVAVGGPAACVTVFSSANLSAQPRAECYTLTTAPAVYHWIVRDFFEAVL